jgi:ZIP family zinc transporter
MGEAILFAVVASSALPLGALIAVWRPPPRAATAALLGFASGALITAVAFELFEKAFEHGGAWRAGIAFFAGATAFVLVDSWLERRKARQQARGGMVGLALLAAVTLDGVPENLAMGVALLEGSALSLLVAIFASNLPEAIVGAQKMRDEYGREDVVLIWTATAVLLAIAVVVGYGALEGVSDDALAWPLGFAAGAVLASLADTLMPEAFSEGGPPGRLRVRARFSRLLPHLGRIAMQRGLCDICLHQKLVPNTRGSVFSLCLRSRTDERYPRYPQVPVLSCPGHEPRPAPSPPR